LNKREQTSNETLPLGHAVITQLGQEDFASNPVAEATITPDLFHALAASHRRLKLMARVTSATIDTVPFATQLHNIAEQIRIAFGASACVVRSIEGDELVLVAASGIPEHQLHPRISTDLGIIPYILADHKAVFVPDVLTDPRTAQALHTLPNSFEFTSYAGAPLLHNDEVIGVLALYSVSGSLAFRKEDLEDLQVLANHVTVALVNERLYRDLERRTHELQEQIAARKSSDAKYRSIFENATEGIFQSTPEGRFVEANPAMARIYGYESPAALIESIDDIGVEVYVDPDRRAQLQALLARDGIVKDFESQIRRRDGKLIWISSHVRVVRDEAGQARYYEGTVEDITARKQAEEDSRRSEHRFRALIENSSDVIAVIDAEGTVKYVSPSVERIVGYCPNERVGDESYTNLHPDDLSISRGAVQRAVESPGEMIHFQVRVRHKEGHWVHLDSVARNLLDDPFVQGIVINTRDITEAKRQEAALATTYEAEKLARKSAELHAEQLRRLQVVTAALSTAVSAAEVARVIVDVGVAALRSASGVLGLLTEDGKHVSIVHHIGYPPGAVEPYMNRTYAVVGSVNVGLAR
jgi:PAS domain S-box-containing protein